jgi:hypothetical protein
VTVIGFCSAKGSPGVTTSVLALAAVWPRPVVLAECDPAGGDIVAGFLRADFQPRTTVLEVALATRRGLTAEDVLVCCQPLGTNDELALLPGLTDPGQVASTAPAWRELAMVFRGLDAVDSGWDLLADCGRLNARGAPLELLAHCDLVVLVLRARLPQVHQAARHLDALRRDLAGLGAEPPLGLLLVGDRPYPPAEVSAALGMPVVAVLPVDDRAARVLSDGAEPGRWFDRAALLRAARQAAPSGRDTAVRGPDHGGRRPAATTSARGDA